MNQDYCKDCELFESKYESLRCKEPKKKICEEFLPREEEYHKYTWILKSQLKELEGKR